MRKKMKKVLTGAGSFFIGTRGSHYRKSLVWLLVLASIPGIIVGGLIYWIAGGRIENELHQLHDKQIRQRAANIDEQFSYLELSLSHWSFDPKFDHRLINMDFGKEFQDSRDLTRTLLVMQGSNPITKRVELFVNGARPILLNPEYNVLGEDSANNYKKLLTQGNAAYWTKFAEDPEQPDQQDITLVHKIPASELHPFGVILIRLDPDKIAGLLKTLTPYNEGETFLMQNDGRIIASAQGTGSNVSFDQTLQKAVAKHRENQSAQGSFLLDWERKTYTVSYGSMTRIGGKWIYVSAAPIDTITAPVVFISKLIWMISFVVLLLAMAMAWFASSRIYSPVHRLVQLLSGGKTTAWEKHVDEFELIESEWHNLTRESVALQSKLEEHLVNVREGFLLQLTQGFLYAYSEEDLRERMKHYGWDVEHRQFIVLYMQLTGFANLEGRFLQGDEGLVTFAAANMIEELAAVRAFHSDVVNFHDLTIGLLITAPNDKSIKTDLEALSEDIMQAINQVVKMRVTIAISRPSGSVTQISSLFEEAKQALSYRNFMNQNQIIDMDKPDFEGETEEFRYPFSLERDVIQALRTGQREEAIRLLGEFLDILSGEGAKEIDVQQGMLQMLASIQHTIMHSGMNPKQIYQGVNMFGQLSEIRDPKEMLSWFHQKIIAPYMHELEQRSDSHVKKLIESVMIFIQNNYMKEISLEQCADMTGTSSYFLSKSFKQVTGKNFIDYLTELRMEKAKELIRDTELKINEIAEQVGYQHSYFNRIFKKQENMTPTQFREFSRNKNM